TPDAGTIDVLGQAPHGSPRARARLGYAAGDERSLFQRLTGRHNLEFFGALHGLSPTHVERRIRELDVDFDLREPLERRVDQCSAGMKARLGLARALLHEPDVLLLDEPTKSLDAGHAAAVHKTLRRLLEGGLVVLAATHSGAEAEQL